MSRGPSPYCRARATHDLVHKARASLEIAAPSIGARVRRRREELVDEVAVRTVDLDAVEAG